MKGSLTGLPAHLGLVRGSDVIRFYRSIPIARAIW